MNAHASNNLVPQAQSFCMHPSKSKDTYVFLSYSWKNTNEINKLYAVLDQHLIIWRDIHGLNGADDLWDTIAEAILNAKYIVALISEEYEASKSCRDELAFSLNQNKIVIPILIDKDFRPLRGVGIRISNLQYFRYESVLNEPLTLIGHMQAMHRRYGTSKDELKCLKKDRNNNDTNSLSSKKGESDENKENKSTLIDSSHLVLNGHISINSNQNLIQTTSSRSHSPRRRPLTLNDRLDSMVANAEPTQIYETDYDEHMNENMHSIESTVELSLQESGMEPVENILSISKTNDVLIACKNGSFYLMKRVHAQDTHEWSHLNARLQIQYAQHEVDYLSCELVDSCFDAQKDIVFVLSIKNDKFLIWLLEYDQRTHLLKINGFYACDHKIVSNALFKRIHVENQFIILIDENKRVVYYDKNDGLCKKTVFADTNHRPQCFINAGFYLLGCEGGVTISQVYNFKTANFNNCINNETIIDLAYDATFFDCLFFIDCGHLYRSKIRNILNNEFRYRCIYTNRNKSKVFKRLIIKTDAIYILLFDSQKSYNSIYVYDKRRLEKFCL